MTAQKPFQRLTGAVTWPYRGCGGDQKAESGGGRAGLLPWGRCGSPVPHEEGKGRQTPGPRAPAPPCCAPGHSFGSSARPSPTCFGLSPHSQPSGTWPFTRSTSWHQPLAGASGASPSCQASSSAHQAGELPRRWGQAKPLPCCLHGMAVVLPVPLCASVTAETPGTLKGLR